MEQKSIQTKAIVRARPIEQPISRKDVDGVPSHEAIALLAYEKFCARGYEDGFAEQDWLAAERELLEMHRKTMARA